MKSGMVLCMLFGCVLGCDDPSFEVASAFEVEALPDSYLLFDMGVADIDGDDRLDIFTANHDAAQLLLRNDGTGGFGTSAFSTLGLDQSSEFPGLEVDRRRPPLQAPGLHVYFTRSQFVIGAVAGDAGVLRGRLESPVAGALRARGAIEVVRNRTRSVTPELALSFEARGNGQLEIERISSGGLPVTLALDPSVDLDRVYVGARGVQPRDHRFVLALRDRHGLAWADYNGDGDVDLFVSRGGANGQIEQEALDIHDELLSKDGARFVERTDQQMPTLRGCSGRQAAWVDVDADGLLDLYRVCGRANQASPAPNQLYRQHRDGSFEEVAAAFGLAFPGPGSFAWVDVDADEDLDLLWATDYEFRLYRNTSRSFVGSRIGAAPSGSWPKKLALADFDADGDFDAFSASPDGNTLLVNEGGTYHDLDPARIGLPDRSWTAGWVDFDADGMLDFHAVPDGVYRQRPDGNFVETGLLKGHGFRDSVRAHASWLDVEDDGDLDVVIASIGCLPPGYCRPEQAARAYLQRHLPGLVRRLGIDPYRAETWTLRLYRARANPHHWLHVDLLGPVGNRPAIGARVSVVQGDRRQTAQVGQFDGSLFSQGNYRLFFGLGSTAGIDRLEIRWPDGRIQVLEHPPGDRQLVLRYAP
jgi:ASPIC and UnbV/FG-GAP-like repeat